MAQCSPLGCCFDGCVLRLHLLVASVPGSPAGGRDGACLPLDHVVRCLSASGAVVQVLAVWGPLLVPGSFDSPATGILSFEVVVEWFSSSHCWSLLHWRHLSVFRPASAGDRYLSSLRAGDCGLPLRRRVHARVLMAACLPLLRVSRMAPSHIPLICSNRILTCRINSICSPAKVGLVVIDLITSPVVSWRGWETTPPSTAAQLPFFVQPRLGEDLSLCGGLLFVVCYAFCLRLVDVTGLPWTFL